MISCLFNKEMVRLYLMSQKTNFTVRYESFIKADFPHNKVTRSRPCQ